jgi:HlyD family secretion protein
MTGFATATAAAPPPATAGNYRRYANFGYRAIAAVFGAFGIWVACAPLDSAAIAPARVSVESDRKPLQHLEGGIVSEIRVREAQPVEEGEVLFRLQPTQAQANRDLLAKQLDAALAQEARLIAERNEAAEIAFPDELMARRHLPETATIIADQRNQFAERSRLRNNELGILRSRIEQTSRDIAGRKLRATGLAAQLASFKAEIAAVMPLVEKGYYARNKLRVLERERDRIEGEIGFGQGDIGRLEQTIAETHLQIEQARQRQQELVAQQLADIRVRISDLREKGAVALDVLSRVEVRAPRAGIVQAVKVHTVGAVVRPGETLAEIVPTGDSLILSARVSPLDIQSVATGQKAEVRFPAFARKLPPIFGKVETISADALVDEVTRQPYYAARVRIDQASIPAELAGTLVPGMPADVLISTGERTVLRYLLGPLSDAMARSMRER